MKKSKEAVFEDKDYTEENPEQIFGNLYDGKLTVQDGKVKIAYDGDGNGYYIAFNSETGVYYDPYGDTEYDISVLFDANGNSFVFADAPTVEVLAGEQEQTEAEPDYLQYVGNEAYGYYDEAGEWVWSGYFEGDQWISTLPQTEAEEKQFGFEDNIETTPTASEDFGLEADVPAPEVAEPSYEVQPEVAAEPVYDVQPEVAVEPVGETTATVEPQAVEIQPEVVVEPIVESQLEQPVEVQAEMVQPEVAVEPQLEVSLDPIGETAPILEQVEPQAVQTQPEIPAEQSAVELQPEPVAEVQSEMVQPEAAAEPVTEAQQTEPTPVVETIAEITPQVVTEPVVAVVEHQPEAVAEPLPVEPAVAGVSELIPTEQVQPEVVVESTPVAEVQSEMVQPEVAVEPIVEPQPEQPVEVQPEVITTPEVASVLEVQPENPVVEVEQVVEPQPETPVEVQPEPVVETVQEAVAEPTQVVEPQPQAAPQPAVYEWNLTPEAAPVEQPEVIPVTVVESQATATAEPQPAVAPVADMDYVLHLTDTVKNQPQTAPVQPTTPIKIEVAESTPTVTTSPVEPTIAPPLFEIELNNTTSSDLPLVEVVDFKHNQHGAVGTHSFDDFTPPEVGMESKTHCHSNSEVVWRVSEPKTVPVPPAVSSINIQTVNRVVEPTISTPTTPVVESAPAIEIFVDTPPVETKEASSNVDVVQQPVKPLMPVMVEQLRTTELQPTTEINLFANSDINSIIAELKQGRSNPAINFDDIFKMSSYQMVVKKSFVQISDFITNSKTDITNRFLLIKKELQAELTRLIEENEQLKAEFLNAKDLSVYQKDELLRSLSNDFTIAHRPSDSYEQLQKSGELVRNIQKAILENESKIKNIQITLKELKAVYKLCSDTVLNGMAKLDSVLRFNKKEKDPLLLNSMETLSSFETEPQAIIEDLLDFSSSFDKMSNEQLDEFVYQNLDSGLNLDLDGFDHQLSSMNIHGLEPLDPMKLDDFDFETLTPDKTSNLSSILDDELMENGGDFNLDY
ncbi:terminal organelle protein HMW1 [Mycoplasmoides pneumoniae]|uniref:Cytadherence high molecular weight protein 1 n=1 Tax=Mycoplasma pneumoniae (strain ATCC 29342 / M129 / Subtype 1) TaxID=272634 RepID=HMW1_MYCPN|nr:terminal organelle protein HMW1 [Mycoplasmoides pneumoniae]Q50365.1 RecName: Full=Cytadherence high molecular weight protein 1; AltName: Full=Cytadherence accessory protein 1 [Mycoplasmoides pneumoniae M129]AAA61697.1 HMW1 [Mycoplasmoides pneumoniae]AAB96042.1 cytadherence accessory protein HMW1 [Mycoplasmoides pneumoniae M129]AGC04347.1 cytadherence high molecular weight protein 1 [Mycoplasmoides pneumoniae M129-B7]ALA30324.1 cytadherence high molecular weight protein 1 [Mycoplasmoides pne